MTLISVRVCSFASGLVMASNASWHHSSFVKGPGPKPRCCMKSSRVCGAVFDGVVGTVCGVVCGAMSPADNGTESAAAITTKQTTQRIFQTQKAMLAAMTWYGSISIALSFVTISLFRVRLHKFSPLCFRATLLPSHVAHHTFNECRVFHLNPSPSISTRS
jgi:hypothetical protein